MIELIGFLGGFGGTVWFIPQVIRVIRLRSAREISLVGIALVMQGAICWIIYGVVKGLMPVVIWNIIGLSLNILLLYSKLKYGMEKR